jgi:hypothetical protein
MGAEPACVRYDPASGDDGGGDNPPTLTAPQDAVQWLEEQVGQLGGK